ncbi:phosphoglucosamine mutase [Egicoccus halophilus]|uniref:Phosphoglucosamine mutase n=1 Tax=Egicoccus halophilus TaxID=1670830 RepID=A0A8J3AEQ5_9ACTN|nr:phosphoglucosamine mutase [Egicoccus halophilus]GGI05885.1 phosphoglucosamine mutase [Egicoccus halophilus]
MGSIFGTDGVRGKANADLTPELALALGRALVTVLREDGTRRPSILIGRDPRWSGEMLESALIAGITSAGGDAVSVGVLPTPAVAHLTAHSAAAAGAMISASHNPVGDNGIKFFGPEGYKLTDAEEERLEQLIAEDAGERPLSTDIGRRLRDHAAVARYVEYLATIADVDLTGLRIVVDGANGAASNVGPQVYRQLGADVVTVHCRPDGANINAGCGSTHPEVVSAAVLEHRADAGISHDGDADRLIAATHEGVEVDGDVILAVLARDAKHRGALAQDTVVTTVMTNLGFKRAMAGLHIDVLETKVGDRYVLEAMRERGLNLGGEQSGHLIDLDHATTGDGILSAVRLLSVVRSTGASLRELTDVMARLPQVLVNVRGVDKSRLDTTDAVWDVVRREEERLGDGGRVLLRPSGTEALVRVMAEAETADDAQLAVDRIADAVRDHLTV